MRWLWVAVPVLLGGVLLGASPAYAHVELTSSTPADGATLDTAPREAVLTFSGGINPELAEAAVTVDGKSVDATPVTVKGATVTVPLPGDKGDYRVAYRVVSGDGHPVDGELRFTATAPAGEPGPAASSAPASPPDGGESVGAARTSSPAAKARTVTRSWVWPVVGLGAVGLIGGLAYVLISGRKRREDVPSGGTDSTDRDGGHREAD